ncbi:peptide chain release factor N(5)-glutamine methyltransferase [Jiulongibacter sediminis]|jgi:release factor glutamine methyltransferase|uniref:peptide chain release factor N(5)-glutamine methyltransferase n=1 Tax=Jiulongibacter sediminis TaxID=1605367 RepID=UPI0026EA364E|nr:peptide chain release factor N(5)-glutamine methyltransferase [Jiulongibacter sediminis]
MSFLGAKSIFDQTLQDLYIEDESERKSVAFLLLEDGFGISKMDIILNKSVMIDELLLEEYVERINRQEPIQQIVGFTYFASRKFKVDKNVLIPRPETEELISIIKSLQLDQPAILDIGTGSGCLAISLALELINSEVWALDISEGALKVAMENAKSLKASVKFLHEDILKEKSTEVNLKRFDLIVSNPPYIRNLEKSQMKANVIDYEPHLALFVENDNPLIFYKRIADLGIEQLNKDGLILAEINSYLGEETRQLFEKKGYEQVEILKDFYGKDRFVKAKKGLV